jgi:hypothetical protein
VRCHGSERPKSGLRLDDRDAALKGGYLGGDIMPGDSANSRLIHYVSGLVEDMVMPPAGKGDPLTNEQIALLRAWIDQGAAGSSQPASPPWNLTLTPSVGWTSVEGDASKFREHNWRQEGWWGGLEQFSSQERLGPDTTLTLNGRALFNQGDYGLALELRRRDLGFARAGYDSYRKYFDDTGGFYAPYGVPPPSLDRALSVDLGRAWLQLGLAMPDLPQITLGYEYRFKEGDESTLHWGQYSPDPTAFVGKMIYPNYQSLDERVQSITLDVRHDLAGVALEDNLLLEFYDLNVRQVNQGSGTPDTIEQFRQDYGQFQAANVLRAEKQLRDWLFLSGGYLYTHTEGSDGFDQAFTSVSGAFPPFSGETSRQISVERQSNTLNGNTQLGPWSGLSLVGGVQAEWRRQTGISGLTLPGFPAAVPANQSSSLDRTTLDETVSVRYDGIPFTVLHADARLQQEWVGYSAGVFIDDGNPTEQDFQRQTDVQSGLQRYGGGAVVSPWPQLTLEADYEWRGESHEYTQGLDMDGSSLIGNGYPGFITGREQRGQDVQARLIWRALAWLKVTLKYQWAEMAYRTDTASAELPAFPSNVLYPGGWIGAGDQRASTYSIGLTMTPWRRLYLSTDFSYGNSRLVTGDDDGLILVPYSGDLYSLVCSGHYVLNRDTDLRFGYSYSAANYAQSNVDQGLPLGIEFARQGLLVGVTRQLGPRVKATLQYGFFIYREPTADHATDYTANAIFGGFTLAFP